MEPFPHGIELPVQPGAGGCGVEEKDLTVLRMEEMERPVPNLRGSRRFRYSVYGVWAYMHWSDPCHGQQNLQLLSDLSSWNCRFLIS